MMMRFFVLATLSALIAACDTRPSNDTPTRTVFRITAGMTSKIQTRHLESVNAVRQSQGLLPLQLSSQLVAAAQGHAQDMSAQARPWHFGSDGSSPIERVARSGYVGPFLAENISETFENDLETLEAWMRDPVTRRGILNPNARAVGFSWHQDPNGKIWWVQVIGG